MLYHSLSLSLSLSLTALCFTLTPSLVLSQHTRTHPPTHLLYSPSLPSIHPSSHTSSSNSLCLKGSNPSLCRFVAQKSKRISHKLSSSSSLRHQLLSRKFLFVSSLIFARKRRRRKSRLRFSRLEWVSRQKICGRIFSEIFFLHFLRPCRLTVTVASFSRLWSVNWDSRSRCHRRWRWRRQPDRKKVVKIVDFEHRTVGGDQLVTYKQWLELFRILKFKFLLVMVNFSMSDLILDQFCEDNNNNNNNNIIIHRHADDVRYHFGKRNVNRIDVSISYFLVLNTFKWMYYRL